MVTPGAKPILFFTILATVDEGDEVLLPDPGFPIYESVVRYIGATSRSPVPLYQERDFRFDPDDLRRRVTDRTRLIILNSPHNPTGGVLAPEDLHAVAEVAVARDLWVLSDEIYSRLLYAGEHHSVAALPGMAERTVILDGFSKTYAMTGWRLGYGVAPPALVPALTRLQTNVTSCTAGFVQLAGVAALEGPQDGVAGDAGRVPAPAGAGGGGPQRHPRGALPGPRGGLLRLPPGRRPGAEQQERWPTPCSRRRGWPCSPAPPSAPRARASCASPSPTRRTSCGRGSTGSGAASSDCVAEAPGPALQLGEVPPVDDRLVHQVAAGAQGHRPGADEVRGVLQIDAPGGHQRDVRQRPPQVADVARPAGRGGEELDQVGPQSARR